MGTTSQRNPDINIPAFHLRPTTTVDALGNTIANGVDAPVTTTTPDGSCLVAVIPSTLRRSPYVEFGGGQEGSTNLRPWLVAVIGAPTLTEGDLIDVPEGQTAGKYRAHVVNPTPPGEQIVLVQSFEER